MSAARWDALPQGRMMNLPTAGDIEREPDEPVGDGVGRIAIEFGVPGVAPTPLALQFEPSLLFCPIESYHNEREKEKNKYNERDRYGQ